ncbi:Coronin-2B [Nowakowskiella sp. JEL0078]|nr:Coronin-2B [Nowakowskiella sp. JEL0078]
MVEVIRDLEPMVVIRVPPSPMTEINSLLESPIKSPKSPLQTAVELTSSRRSSTLIRRARSLSNLADEYHNLNSFLSSGSTVNLTESLVQSLAVYLDGYIDIERKGWLGSMWERHYLSLKKTKLYVSVDQDAEIATNCILIKTIRRIECFNVGKNIPESPTANQIGFLIESNGLTTRFRSSSHADRENWVKALRAAKERSVGIPTSEDDRKLKPIQTLPTLSPSGARASEMSRDNSAQRLENNKIVVGNREGAALIGQIQVLVTGNVGPGGVSLKPNPGSSHSWQYHFAVLDEEGLIHIYPPDIRDYVQGKPPLESLNLSAAISVRLTDITAGWISGDFSKSNGALTIFQINTTKRVLFFKTRSAFEAANWVLEIRRIVVARGMVQTAELIANDCVEGYVDVWFDNESKQYEQHEFGHGSRTWLSVIDGSFYYFESHLSQSPLLVIPASRFEGVKAASILEPMGSGKLVSTSSDNTSKGNRKLDLHCFDVNFPSTIGTIRHVVYTKCEFDMWLKELNIVRMESFDLLGKLGINSDAIFLEEMGKAKTTAGGGFTEVIVPGVINVDEKKLDRGECPPILICVSGKVRITIFMVDLSFKALKIDCAFVLDTGSIVYHWNGEQSTRVCRAKAMDVATRIRKTRSNRPRVFLVDETEPEYMRKFFQHLGVMDPKHSIFISQPNTHENIFSILRIFKIIESQIRRRRLKLCYEGIGPSKQILDSENVYVIQCPPNEIFIWIGKLSNISHRALANVVLNRSALEFRKDIVKRGIEEMESIGRSQVLVQKVYENHETAVFREKFLDYEGSLPINMRATEIKGNIVTGLKQTPIDIQKLLSPLEPQIDDIENLFSEDKGKDGKVSIFIVRDFEKYPVAKNLHGQFFSSESYILLYVFRPLGSGVDQCISYFWQGSHSSITQKGTSALITIELSKETSGDVMQVRVVEGKG